MPAPWTMPERASSVVIVRFRAPASVPPLSTTVGSVVAGDVPSIVTVPPESVRMAGAKDAPFAAVIDPPDTVTVPAPSITPPAASGRPPPETASPAAAATAMCPPSLPEGAAPLMANVPPWRSSSPSTSRIVFARRSPPATTSEPVGVMFTLDPVPPHSWRLSAPTATSSRWSSCTRPPFETQIVPSVQVPSIVGERVAPSIVSVPSVVFVNDPITVVVAPPIVPFRASRVFTVRARVPPSVPPRTRRSGGSSRETPR